MEKDKDTILEIKEIKTYFPVKKGFFNIKKEYIKAVDGITFNLKRGETLGIVGESGCGKSTLCKTIVKLCNPESGSIIYKDENKSYNLLDKKNEPLLRKKVQYIFQDPQSSLNPAFTIYNSLSDGLLKNGIKSKAKRREILGDMLEKVNMRADQMDLFPNEFSGGQRQRIGIARALLVHPEIVICDEAVSALDVSIQAQVLQLLNNIQKENKLTYIFVTHDLSVVEYISDRIAVMYLGKIVEMGETEELFANMHHPYTQALRSAVPVAEINHNKERIILEGDVPSLMNLSTGCYFHNRCKHCMQICKEKEPKLKKYNINGKEYFVACHMAHEKLKYLEVK